MPISRPSLTTTGVVNSEVQLKKALLSDCLNFALSLVFWYTALADRLHGNHPSRPDSLNLLWIQNHGHQRVPHWTPVYESSCQRHWHSISICLNQIYNNNKAAVQWASSVTSKWIKHLNLRENMAHEWHQSNNVDADRIPGIINPSDIFMKEMNDIIHFINLRYFMMVSLKDFLKYSHNVPSNTLFLVKNHFLLFNTVRMHSSRQSRTQNRHS